MTDRARLICLLVCCALLLCGCMTSPPDSLKRSGTEGQRLISASTEGLAPDQKSVTLYFRYGSTGFLAPEARLVTVQRNESLEKAVVKALLGGPLNAALSPLFPSGVEALSAVNQDGTLFLTLNEALLGRYPDEPGDVSLGAWKTEGPLRRQLCLDSLAATLTEAGLCDRVQVLVERSQASMRLTAGFLNRSADAALLPMLTRNEDTLLTPHNTAQRILQSWREQDWNTLSAYTANASGEQSALDAFAAAEKLVDYTLSCGSVSFDGQTALVTADLTLQGQGQDTAVPGYPLRLIREDGIWKMDYETLLDMMGKK